MRVVNSTTGAEVAPGSMIHMVGGPSAGQAWRLEKVVPRDGGEHHLHVSRHHPKVGRVHKEYHPHLFGCAVVIDVKLYADVVKLKHALSFVFTQAVLLTVGGIIAYLVAEYMGHGA